MRVSGLSVLVKVAKSHQMSLAVMRSPSRKRPIAWARQEAMYQMFVQCPHLSTPAISRLLGFMDHTTVIHGIRAYCGRIGVTYQEAKDQRNRLPLTPAVFRAYGEAMQRAA